MGATYSPIQSVPGFFPGGKLGGGAKRKIDHKPSFSVEFQDEHSMEKDNLIFSLISILWDAIFHIIWLSSFQ
jgi:hypothetical protein